MQRIKHRPLTGLPVKSYGLNITPTADSFSLLIAKQIHLGYLHLQAHPSAPSFYAVSSPVEANANGDVIPLGASATYVVPTDNWLTDLNWLPETTDEGIHEIFALAYDDDHNVIATRPVELRIINKQAREPRIVEREILSKIR